VRALADLNPPPLAPAEEQHLSQLDEFELPALPSSLAPGWAARVRAAWADAHRGCSASRGRARGGVYSAEALKLWALATIRFCSDEPLSLVKVEYAAHVVTSRRAWWPSTARPQA
jgi:hypothetical protein